MDIQNKDEKIAYVVERFLYHSRVAETSDNPIVADSAKSMCNVDIWEMWVLTQE